MQIILELRIVELIRKIRTEGFFFSNKDKDNYCCLRGVRDNEVTLTVNK